MDKSAQAYEVLINRVAQHIGVDPDTEQGYLDAEYVLHVNGLWDDEGDETWREARRTFFNEPRDSR